MDDLNKKYAPNKCAGLISVLAFSLIFIWLTFGLDFIRGSSSYWQTDVGDVTQYLAGINLYLLSPWHYPLPAFDSLNYPQGTRVTFIDGIPIFAFLLKIFVPKASGFISPLGYWVGFCFLLQGVSAWWITRELNVKSWAFLIFLTLTFLTFPALMARLMHVALMSHWIVLFAIALYIRGHRLMRLPMYAWVILLVLSYYIHIYLFAMAAGIYVASLLELKQKIQLPKKRFLWLPFLLLFVSLFIFLLPMPTSYITKGGGFGIFSMNVLAPILGGKIIAIQAQAMPGQGEGFNYLGLGVIAALLMVIFSQFSTCRVILKTHRPFFVLMMAYTIYALSDHIYFGQQLLATIDYPGFLSFAFEQFRSSGRFFWPVGYSIIIFSAYMLYQHLNKRAFCIIISIILLIQLIDVSDNYKILRTKRDSPSLVMFNYSALNKALGSRVKYIYFYPKYDCAHNVPFDALLALMKYTAVHDLKLNTGYIARIKSNCLNYVEEVNESSHRESAYVFLKTQYPNVISIKKVMGDKNNYNCQELDFAYVCRFANEEEN